MPKQDKHLTPEDLEIWQRVSRTVRAYQPARPLPPTQPAPKTRRALLALRPLPTPPKPKTSPIDRPLEMTVSKRTRRGKLSIDRKIDLHDMTQDQALTVLTQSIYRAQEDGHRCVLVVTGKGGVNYKGVLRRMLPMWLASPALRPKIASYAQAHQRHGGAGAWYVFLKA